MTQPREPRTIYGKPAKSSSGTQLAAAVAMREGLAGGAEFLLVRTSDGERWTFPKGHRDRGETLALAAAREASEEAGVRGSVEPEPFAHYRYAAARGRVDLVAAFLLSVEHEGLPAEPQRDPEWFGFEAARDRLAAGRAGDAGEEMERVLLAAKRSGCGGLWRNVTPASRSPRSSS